MASLFASGISEQCDDLFSGISLTSIDFVAHDLILINYLFMFRFLIAEIKTVSRALFDHSSIVQTEIDQCVDWFEARLKIVTRSTLYSRDLHHLIKFMIGPPSVALLFPRALSACTRSPSCRPAPSARARRMRFSVPPSVVRSGKKLNLRTRDWCVAQTHCSSNLDALDKFRCAFGHLTIVPVALGARNHSLYLYF